MICLFYIFGMVALYALRIHQRLKDQLFLIQMFIKPVKFRSINVDDLNIICLFFNVNTVGISNTNAYVVPDYQTAFSSTCISVKLIFRPYSQCYTYPKDNFEHSYHIYSVNQ